MRLDADIVAGLKQGGRGYQTKANALLRREMLRLMEQQQRPSVARKGRRTLPSKKAVS
jgi:BrnA antitoxin of type II toxin-antitoxin system